MGIPYSREIDAAFGQVTPLVAAGFRVLKTTRNISILLAVIQVLTVFILGLILVALVAIMYCVNPDLEHERQLLITPPLRRLANLTVYATAKFLAGCSAVLAIFAGTSWYFLALAREWNSLSVEKEGDEDADGAL
ncbi:hypothetical protein CC80DRAFT_366543, partial [Byssothecium circinans]